MITLGSPSPTALADLARQPGGFLWWYADLTTQAGDGVVLIWSLGLPFLSGQAAQLPADRPALCVALYRGGRSDFYLLQDYGGSGCSVSIGNEAGGNGRLGHTTFRSARVGKGLELEVQLDEPIPGSRTRLTGSFSLVGSECLLAEASSGAAHVWAPRVIHGLARAELELGAERVELVGAGYFDSNFSRVPLVRQGIARWLWGRVAFVDRTLVYYRTEMDGGEVVTRVLTQRASGELELATPELGLGRVKRGAFGLDSPRQIGFRAGGSEVQLDLGQPVEDGPFYQRFLLEGRDLAGLVGRGVAEVVVPGMVDVAWQRPLVRMRTHVVGGRNSVWLPLFSGPRRGRLQRLLRGVAA
jgi:carotenoid 1,2-hydratase